MGIPCTGTVAVLYILDSTCASENRNRAYDEREGRETSNCGLQPDGHGPEAVTLLEKARSKWRRRRLHGVETDVFDSGSAGGMV